jgi:hypothetical protein
MARIYFGNGAIMRQGCFDSIADLSEEKKWREKMAGKMFKNKINSKEKLAFSTPKLLYVTLSNGNMEF